jgi:hypothetical protein
MNIGELEAKVIQFLDDRTWTYHQNPTHVAISLSLEATELMEALQWKNADQVEALQSQVKFQRMLKEDISWHYGAPLINNTNYAWFNNCDIRRKVKYG